MSTRIVPAGMFWMVHKDRKGRVLWAAQFRNGVTYEGVNHFGNAVLRGGSRFSNWYVGLIDQSGFSALADSDTHASHPGWNESLLVSARGLWLPGAASGGLVAPTAGTVLSLTGSGAVRGAFLASRQATGLASGAVLYATGAAGSGLPVTAGGTISINYSVRYTPR